MTVKRHLPLELYESILNELVGDQPSLRQCALVCHHLSVHSQKLLFKRIVLGRPSKILIQQIMLISSPTDKFYNHIQKFPYLRRLIYELVITDGRERKYYREGESWIRQDRMIARILPLLEDLQSLEIEGNTKGERLNFQAWKPDLKSAISLKMPSLIRLSLSYVRNVPVGLLYKAPKLRNVILYFVLFAPQNIEVNETASPIAALESFEYQTLSEKEWASLSLPGPRCPLDLTRLTTLYMVSNTGNLDLVTRLINECQNTLQDLSISFPEEVTSPAMYNDSYLDLGCLPALRKLSLEGFLWSYISCNHKLNTIGWLVSILRRIPPINKLNHIRISLVIMDSENVPLSGLAGARWDDFIEVLLRLREYAFVTLSIRVYDSHSSYIISILKNCLDALTGRVELLLEDHQLGDSSGENVDHLEFGALKRRFL